MSQIGRNVKSGFGAFFCPETVITLYISAVDVFAGAPADVQEAAGESAEGESADGESSEDAAPVEGESGTAEGDSAAAEGESSGESDGDSGDSAGEPAREIVSIDGSSIQVDEEYFNASITGVISSA